MAKRKPARAKSTRKSAASPSRKSRSKAAVRKSVRKPAKKTARKTAPRAAAKAARKAAARPAARKATKARKGVRPAAAAPARTASVARRPTGPKAAPRPKRPRRTKQTLPPAPRAIPTPVIDIQAPAAPAPAVEPPAGAAPTVDAEIVGERPSPPPNAGGVATGGPQVGELAPAFALPDETGHTHRLSDYRGRAVVLYFYPKDDTPGCTIEACNFRDQLSAFTDVDAVVLGVSPDTVESHHRFSSKHGLNFTLLADADHHVAEQYGVWVQKQRPTGPAMGIARTTFVIDRDGRIAHVFRNVKPEQHEAEVLQVLQSL